MLGDDRVDLTAVLYPVDVGGEPRIVGEGRRGEHVGDQGAPAAVVLHADEDLAVGGRVGVVRGDRGVAHAHSRVCSPRYRWMYIGRPSHSVVASNMLTSTVAPCPLRSRRNSAA